MTRFWLKPLLLLGALDPGKVIFHIAFAIMRPHWILVYYGEFHILWLAGGTIQQQLLVILTLNFIQNLVYLFHFEVKTSQNSPYLHISYLIHDKI